MRLVAAEPRLAPFALAEGIWRMGTLELQPVDRRTVTRRELLRVGLGTGAVLAGGGLLTACAQRPGALGAPASLPPPETTTVRIVSPFACDPPLWLAKDFLLEEGFTDVRYVGGSGRPRDWATSGAADVGAGHPEEVVAALDGGAPLVALAGSHSGCQEVWVGPGIASLSDLRGKRIGVFRKDTAISSSVSLRRRSRTWASIRSRM